jgi:hypothetical protein
MSSDKTFGSWRWEKDLDSPVFALRICWSYCGCECCLIWVRWIEEAERGGAALNDKLWSGLTCAAVMTHSIHQVGKLICGDRCIRTNKLCSTLYIGKGSVMAIIEQLGYSKVCACWVTRMLTVLCKETESICYRSFAQIQHWRWELPVADRHAGWNWVHNSEPEPKWHLMEWCLTTSP